MGGFDEEMKEQQARFTELMHKQYRNFLEENGIKHLSDIEKIFSFMMGQFALANMAFDAMAVAIAKFAGEIEGIKKQLPIGDYNGEH